MKLFSFRIKFLKYTRGGKEAVEITLYQLKVTQNLLQGSVMLRALIWKGCHFVYDPVKFINHSLALLKLHHLSSVMASHPFFHCGHFEDHFCDFLGRNCPSVVEWEKLPKYILLFFI